MKRRACLEVAVGMTGLGLLKGVCAQTALTDGKDFRQLKQQAAVKLLEPEKKIDLIEFFWYGCPHCNAFEPSLEAWAKKLPKDVQFRRVPVAFGAAHQFHQKLYYTLAAMPNFDVMHKKAFTAIHVDRRRLDTPGAVIEWGKENGLSEEVLGGMLRSMTVDSSVRQAKLLAESYGVDSVPSIGVHGRYITSTGMTGSYERVFAAAEMLMQRVRQVGG